MVDSEDLPRIRPMGCNDLEVRARRRRHALAMIDHLAGVQLGSSVPCPFLINALFLRPPHCVCVCVCLLLRVFVLLVAFEQNPHSILHTFWKILLLVLPIMMFCFVAA
jgi:hypothetical protein